MLFPRSWTALLALVTVLAVAVPNSASASIKTYAISVTVTSAPNAPGAFEPWTFGTLPETTQGTFNADDTASGFISNLQLTVGGLDIATTLPFQFINSFDPSTLDLLFIAVNSAGDSAVVLTSGFIGPGGFAEGIDSTLTGPFDPFFGNTQNWEGTIQIQGVPEPSTLFLFGSGLIGVLGYCRRQQKRKA